MESCENVYQWFEICELTNEQALSLELLAAFIIASFAGILAIIFYFREQSQQDYDRLENIIRDLENNIQVTSLEIQTRDLTELNTEQHSVIMNQEQLIQEMNQVLNNQQKHLLESENKQIKATPI